jgi:hypothetical protein
MAAKKKPVKKKPVKVPFPAEHVGVSEAALEKFPEPPPPAPPDYKVLCKVSAVGERFFSGTVFVSLEATDGQNLVDLLRKDQEVEIHYQRRKDGTEL